MTDTIKFKAVIESIAPYINSMSKIVKDRHIEGLTISLEADGSATIYESVESLAPVCLKTKEGKYLIRTVTEEEVKVGKDALPWT